MHTARAFSCVRYNQHDENWELFCEGCKRRGKNKVFHPLDHAWWDFTNMSRCRTCLRLDRAAWIKEKRRTDPEFKAQQDAVILANKRLKAAIYKRNYRARRKGTTACAVVRMTRPSMTPPVAIKRLPERVGTPSSAPA